MHVWALLVSPKKLKKQKYLMIIFFYMHFYSIMEWSSYIRIKYGYTSAFFILRNVLLKWHLNCQNYMESIQPFVLSLLLNYKASKFYNAAFVELIHLKMERNICSYLGHRKVSWTGKNHAKQWSVNSLVMNSLVKLMHMDLWYKLAYVLSQDWWQNYRWQSKKLMITLIFFICSTQLWRLRICFR